MKFSEAMKHVEEGKKVRQKDWPEGSYSFLDSVDFWLVNSEGQWPKKRSPIGEGVFAEWELFIEEQPSTLFCFSYIIKGMKEGKKISRKCWGHDYVFCNRDGSLLIHQEDSKGRVDVLPWWPCIEDIEAMDWRELL